MPHAARKERGVKKKRKSAASLRRLASATGGEIYTPAWLATNAGALRLGEEREPAQPEWEKGNLFRQSLKLQEQLGAGGGARGVACPPRKRSADGVNEGKRKEASVVVA